LARPGARRESNAELAGQFNCTTDGNSGTAFGNVDDLTIALGKAIKDHPSGKIAFQPPLGSLLAFEKHRLDAFEYDPESSRIPHGSFRWTQKTRRVGAAGS
jgi:hypothetical protein